MAAPLTARVPMRGTGDPWIVGPDHLGWFGVLVRLDGGWWKVTEGDKTDFGSHQATHIARQLRKGYHYDLEKVI